MARTKTAGKDPQPAPGAIPAGWHVEEPQRKGRHDHPSYSWYRVAGEDGSTVAFTPDRATAVSIAAMGNGVVCPCCWRAMDRRQGAQGCDIYTCRACRTLVTVDELDPEEIDDPAADALANHEVMEAKRADETAECLECGREFVADPKNGAENLCPDCFRRAHGEEE